MKGGGELGFTRFQQRCDILFGVRTCKCQNHGLVRVGEESHYLFFPQKQNQTYKQKTILKKLYIPSYSLSQACNTPTSFLHDNQDNFILTNPGVFEGQSYGMAQYVAEGSKWHIPHPKLEVSHGVRRVQH